jgi:hypothetical protein
MHSKVLAVIVPELDGAGEYSLACNILPSTIAKCLRFIIQFMTALLRTFLAQRANEAIRHYRRYRCRYLCNKQPESTQCAEPGSRLHDTKNCNGKVGRE